VTDCIICDSLAKIEGAPVHHAIEAVDCVACGTKYAITPAVVAELRSRQGWSNTRIQLGEALRWWFDSHGEPFVLKRAADAQFIIGEFAKSKG
jgi:hypothetical protein